MMEGHARPRECQALHANLNLQLLVILHMPHRPVGADDAGAIQRIKRNLRY